MRRILFLPTVFAVLFISIFAQTKQKLTESEAAQRFEAFVIKNGYTDLPPTQDKSKLVPEPVEGAVGDESIKRNRYNTLERKPIEIWKGNRLFEDGWSAIFLYKQPCRDCPKNSARLIYMDAYGENIKVEHQDIIKKEKRKKKSLKNAPILLPNSFRVKLTQ
jgi:hypothetical protein